MDLKIQGANNTDKIKDLLELSPMERFLVYKVNSKNDEYAYEIGRERYLSYRKKSQEIFKKIKGKTFDCDSPQNPVSKMIYSLLWDEEVINKAPCGETMNSAMEILRALNEKRSNSIRVLIREIEKKGSVVEEYQSFIEVIHTPGNILPIPNNSNVHRNQDEHIKDYWDLTLACIYNYYTENADQKITDADGKAYDVSYISPQNLDKYKEWLDAFKNWEGFINKNYMNAFVEEEGPRKPKELFPGHFKSVNKTPDNLEIAKVFLKNVKQCIEERNNLMLKKLSEKVCKIYFDMDGVLADFDKGVQELCGLPAPDANNPDENARKIMWKKIKEVPNFYDKLKPMEEGIRLFHELYDIYGDKCEILTGIPKADKGIITAGDDKRSWCKRILPEGVKVNVVYKEEKKNFCTGKDCILIDDLKANIADWESSGGTGILYTGYEDSIKQLN